jgi:hypothetical protein
MKRLLYYAKAQSPGNWLAILIALGVLLWLLLAGQFEVPPFGPRIEDAYILLQLFLPLSLALILAGAPVAERDARTAEIYLSYPHPPSVRLLEQVGLSTFLWALLAGGSAAVVQFRYAPTADLAAVTVVPALALGSAALAGSALTRTQVGGVLAAGAWWAVDLLAPGLNRAAYLFNQWRPVPGLDAQVMQQHLAVVGGVGLMVALWLAGRRTRWID